MFSIIDVSADILKERLEKADERIVTARSYFNATDILLKDVIKNYETDKELDISEYILPILLNFYHAVSQLLTAFMYLAKSSTYVYDISNQFQYFKKYYSGSTQLIGLLEKYLVNNQPDIINIIMDRNGLKSVADLYKSLRDLNGIGNIKIGLWKFSTNHRHDAYIDFLF